MTKKKHLQSRVVWLQDCKSCKGKKEFGMRIQGIKSAPRGAEPLLKQLQVALNASESSERAAAALAITTCTLEQAGFPPRWSPRKGQINAPAFQAAIVGRGKDMACCCLCLLPLCASRLRYWWQLLSSRWSFRAARTPMLSPKAAAVGSWRDGDSHPRAPRGSEQLLPAPTPWGEGKNHW